MKSARKWIRDLFGFSTTEINGFLILVPLMTVLVASEPCYRWWVSNRTPDHAADARLLDSLIAGWESANASPLLQPDSAFPFDPNIVDEPEMRALGFNEVLSKRIAAYRWKGGVFRTKSDLLKIYGLDSTLYNQLYEYIRLPDTLPFRTFPERRQPLAAKTGEKRQLKQKFDINLADTLLFKTVYGIGSRLALRIVRFRDALGGFVKDEQLYEVYGLDSMVVERLLQVSFISSDFLPEKININRANEAELSAHPYIGRKLARMISTYRFQHGDFMELKDIKNLSAVEDEGFERLLPYITLSEGSD